jgi:hypothetical protein
MSIIKNKTSIMRTDKIIKEASDEKLLDLLNCLLTREDDFKNPRLILTKVVYEFARRKYNLKNLLTEEKEIKRGVFFKAQHTTLVEDPEREINVQDIGRSFLMALELKGPTNDRLGKSFSRN